MNIIHKNSLLKIVFIESKLVKQYFFLNIYNRLKVGLQGRDFY